MDKNPYSILEIPEESSFKDIQRAFRTLALKHHPDKNLNSKNASEKFIELKKAYESLKNIKKPSIKKDINKKGSDLSTTIDVSIEDLIENKPLSFYIQRKGLCKTCDGTGSINKRTKKCLYCGGSGLQGLARALGQKKRCLYCNGNGEIPDSDFCGACKGKGLLPEKVRHNIILNPLNHIIIIHKAGDCHLSGEPGNLVVNLNIKNDSGYKVNGLNLIKDFYISPAQAIIGDMLLCTVFNRTIEIKIPPGIKNKDTIILYNQGMSYKGETGYLKIFVNINIPSVITEEEFNLYTKILKIEKEISLWPKALKI